MDWDHEVDVVVLGSGGAGLTAALTAAKHGARVEVFERAPTVGGTTAVSAGIVWVPAHDRLPDQKLPVEDALRYLRAQSFGSMDDELVEAFVRTAPRMLDFLEAHTPLRFVVVPRPDWEPSLPGAKQSGRSFIAQPYDASELGEWQDKFTSFDSTFGGPGFDIRTGARSGGHGGIPLVAGLLKGLLDIGVVPELNARGVELVTDAGSVVGVRIDGPAGSRRVRARRGVILATGGFEWDERLVRVFLRGPIHGATSPTVIDGDGLRMAMAVGAELANMTEASFGAHVLIPGISTDGHVRAWTGLIERNSPRTIVVNRAGHRFVDEVGGDVVEAIHHLDPREGHVNDPAWLVFDAGYLERYGAFGIKPGQPAPLWFSESHELASVVNGYLQRYGPPAARSGTRDPNWFSESADPRTLAAKLGIDPAGLASTLEAWNRDVADGRDREFGRGARTLDRRSVGPQVDEEGSTLGPIDTPPFYGVMLRIGVIGTRGGPRSDRDGRVRHVLGGTIPGLFAAGNAMASIVGRASPGAGGTIGPPLTWGYRAGYTAATGRSADS